MEPCEYGVGEGVRMDFHHGNGRHTPSHHHPKVWHASSVGHADFSFHGFSFDFLRHCEGMGKVR